jgi:thimet oligopeptidase
MKRMGLFWGLTFVFVLGAAGATNDSFRRLDSLQKQATKFNAIVRAPDFEKNPEQIKATVERTIKEGNAALDLIGKLEPRRTTFKNTALALDEAGWKIMLAANRLYFLKETSPDPAVRQAATDAVKEIQEWAVGLEYREDVYNSLKSFADKRPRLEAGDRKLLDEQLRDFRRAGLAVPKAERDHIERLRKELAGLVTDFDSNITKAQKPIVFSRADLDGVPTSFLEQVKTGEDQFTVMANVTHHFTTVMENARMESTRKRLQQARNTLAREENVPLLQKILPLRNDIAARLGYKSWADYQTEIKMVKNSATAIGFLKELKEGLQPKFEAELAEFRTLKIAETGDPDSRIHIWDWRYYSNQLKKKKFSVDAEQLRVYFPMERTLEGMFAIYQSIFGLKFEPLEPSYKWVDDLQLWAVLDARSGEPMGLFYLDLFPREGKYNHFAVFGLIDGKLRSDGKYQRPVVSLVCNFPAPTQQAPSLLSHTEVETLFHEFGHAMHAILTRAPHSRFSGTSVPRDFVEAPSQMLEHWAWDKTVLDSFAADYRDPSKKTPPEILSQLWAARMATEATRYRRQIAFGLTDLVLHSEIDQSNADRVVEISNKLLGEAFLPRPENTAFVAYFGHLMGYDAGYYGYAWADAIAADMGTVFEQSPGGLFDKTAGKRLRDEIYAPGDSRDVNFSIREFLGRERSLKPFLRKIGIESGVAASSK